MSSGYQKSMWRRTVRRLIDRTRAAKTWPELELIGRHAKKSTLDEEDQRVVFHEIMERSKRLQGVS